MYLFFHEAKNIIARQDEVPKATLKEAAQNIGSMLGYSPGSDPIKPTIARAKTKLPPPKGLIPPPTQNETPCTLHISFMNPQQ